MKRLLLWMTFPVGHVAWAILGYQMFDERKRLSWWILPWYQRDNELRPYSDVFRKCWKEF